jgi:putative transcriptional regulator
MKIKLQSNLKKILDERGIKQSHYVRKFGISATTMSALYRGDSLPTLPNAYIIAKELDLKIEDIWYEVEEEKKPFSKG